MLAPMFYLGYLFSELRRRKGRTLLTALGLGVGVGLVVTVSALTTGTEKVSLEAPVDLGLIALAIGLALLGGLIAGSVGGLRVSRLRPADALRHSD